MLYRIKQFVAALTAYIDEPARQLLQQYLTAAERSLFDGMSLADQQHSLAVARTAIKLARRKTLDFELLVRAALLHDVGRRRGDLGVAGKVVMVLLSTFVPKLSRRLEIGASIQPHFLRRWGAAYYGHPEQGALLLRAAGTPDRVVELVRKHHKAPAGDDPPELTLLRNADNKN